MLNILFSSSIIYGRGRLSRNIRNLLLRKMPLLSDGSRRLRWRGVYQSLLRQGLRWGQIQSFICSRLMTYVISTPFSAANVAKLVFAEASHVVAAFILLDHHFASLTLPKLKVILQKQYAILVALSFMSEHHAFPAKNYLANCTPNYFLCDVHETFAVIIRTQFQLRIFAQVEKHKCLIVSLSLVYAKRSDVRGLNFQDDGTIFCETPNWLKVFD